jgi:type VI secretion system protein ImpG
MFAKFYQSELAYLREMGREFAAAYPNSAGLLSERSDDPDVERLLEGFAFLTAQIRERVDDAVPELVHGLAELLIPQALRPLPAMSIVEFRPALESIRDLGEIPRGRALAAKPIAGTACGFQTCYATDLLPLELVGAEHDEALARQPVIRLRLRTSAAGRPLLARAGPLRLFLAGELALASTLHLWLLRHCERIELRSRDSASTDTARATAPLRVLDREAISAVGLAPEQAVLPWPELAPDGVRYVQEYFALPSKYLFVDVHAFAGVELSGDELELAFVFDRPPPLPSPISDETFRLHCTPVINLFSASAEPIRHDPLRPDQPVRVAGVDVRHAEVYGVTSVTGIRPGRGNRRRYTNFYRFAHTRPGDGDDGYYVVRRSRSPIDEGIDSHLRIARARDSDARDEDETLSIELSCCNRSLPLELQIGDICQPVRGSAVPPFANISSVSAPVRAPLAGELQWRLLAHLAVNRRRVSEADNLRQLVSLYNFADATRSPAGRANALRVEAIRATEFQAITRMLDGAPVRGAETTVELDESRFASLGDAHLFGLVLDELLASYCGINSYQQLRVRLYPSKGEWRWTARSGRQRIV